MMRQVFVTGASGFIGGRLIEVLGLEGAGRLRALVRNPGRAARIARFPVELVTGGMLDAEALRHGVAGCSHVFHCAYDGGGTADQQHAVNVDGTRMLLEAAAAAGVERLVHVSTVEVYAPSAGKVDETSPRYTGNLIYPRFKLEAERLVLEEGSRLGLAVSVVQPAVVYGPYGTYWTERVLTAMRAGAWVLVDAGAPPCNAVYVDDVVSALCLAASRPEAVGEAFLISAAAPVTWRDFFGAYAAMLGGAALLPVSAGRARAEWEARHSSSGSIGYLVDAWRKDPAFRETLRGAPVVQASYRLGKRFLGDERWQRSRARLGVQDLPVNGHTHHPQDAGSTGGNAPADATGDGAAVDWPAPAAIELFTRPSRVSIEKAAARLGYRPRFDLASGMAMSEAWARWARYLPEHRKAD